MTRLQTKIEDKTNLAIMSKKIGLGKYFIISQQIESLNGRNLEKIHEDVFEAFLGALFLSNGFEPCCLLLINLLETIIDYSDKLYRDNNYKDILLRYYHKQKWIYPKYHEVYKEGPPHKRTYIMGVESGGEEPIDSKNFKETCVGFGIGSSKKEGEQNAAKMALIVYGFLKNDQFEKTDVYYPDWDKIEKCKVNEEYFIFFDPNEGQKPREVISNTQKKDDDVDVSLGKLEIESDDNSSVVSNLSEETLSE